MAILYRENKGAPLSVSEIDNNFRSLDTRLGFLENGQISGVEGIQSVSQDGNKLSFIGTQGSVFGPVELPMGLDFVGDWTAGRFYDVASAVLYNGSSYVCIRPHMSSSTFFSDLELERWTPLAYKGSDGAAGSRWYIKYGLPETNAPVEFRAGIDIYLDALTQKVYELNPATMVWSETTILGANQAIQVSFDPVNTSFTSTNLQDVIEEIDARFSEFSGTLAVDGGQF